MNQSVPPIFIFDMQETSEIPASEIPVREEDWVHWLLQQADLVNAGQWDSVDASFVASILRSAVEEKKAKIHAAWFTVIDRVMLVRNFPIEERFGEWRTEICNAAGEIASLLRESPSLEPAFIEAQSRPYHVFISQGSEMWETVDVTYTLEQARQFARDLIAVS